MARKCKIYTDCIYVVVDGVLAIKFAEYVIHNWEHMRPFKGDGLCGHDYWKGTFSKESLPYIEKFFKDNKKKYDKIY